MILREEGSRIHLRWTTEGTGSEEVVLREEGFRIHLHGQLKGQVQKRWS